MDRLTAWMNQLLDSPQSRYRTIARSAIENILSFNINSEAFFEHILENCYSHQPASNITAGYFLGMVDLLARKEKWDHPVPKIVCLTLYHMCNDNITIRKGAARLLLILDKKLSGSVHEVGLSQDIIGWYQTAPAGGLEDDAVTLNMDQTEVIPDGPATIETTAICSSLPLIYNRTRLKVSQRLAKEYPQMIHQVFSAK
jgi:hypothetical protein